MMPISKLTVTALILAGGGGWAVQARLGRLTTSPHP